MAATNFTPISLYYSTTASAVPSSGNLVAGELALNTLDEKLYFKNSAGTVKLLASNAGASGSVTSVSGTGTVNGLTLTGTVTTSGNLTLGGTLSLVSPPPIGSTSPNTGAFTTLSATGQFTSTAGASGILLNNGTSNSIVWNTNGLGAPTFTTRSAGTKLVVYPSITVSSADYALGMEGSFLWSSCATTADGFKWYGGTTLAATLTGAGNLSLAGTLSATGAITNTAGTANGVTYLNGSKVLTSGTALVFDGTDLTYQSAIKFINNDGSANKAILSTYVYGGSGATGTLNLSSTYGNANQTRIKVGTSGAAVISFENDSVENMRLTTSGSGNGNLLIGTTSSTFSAGGRGVIEIRGSGTSLVSLNAGSALAYIYNDGSSLNIQNNQAGIFTLSNNSAVRFQIGSAGQFGIGGATYGTAGQVFTSGGSGAAPTWTTVGAAGLVLISSTDVTSAATISLLNSFSATYDNYLIVGNGLAVASAGGVQIQVRVATAGVARTSGHNWSVTNAGNFSNENQWNVFYAGIESSTSRTCSFQMTIFDVNNTTRNKTMTVDAIAYREGADWQGNTIFGSFTGSTAALSGIQVLVNSGNFTAQGNIKIYGFKNS
jgi:hypothetical protein